MKICLSCQNYLTDEEEKCDNCGYSFGTSGTSTNSAPIVVSRTEGWMYLIAFIIPLAGVILGCIQVAKNDNGGAKGLFAISILSMVICTLIIGIMIYNAYSDLISLLSIL